MLRTLARLCAVVVLCTSARAFRSTSLGGWFRPTDTLPVFARDLGSARHPHIHHLFTKLPACVKNESVHGVIHSTVRSYEHSVQYNIGTRLIGSNTYPVPFHAPAAVDLACTAICAPITIPEDQLRYVHDLIADEYMVQYIIGVLPAVRPGMVVGNQCTGRPSFGMRIGYLDPISGPIYHNHVHFDVTYAVRGAAGGDGMRPEDAGGHIKLLSVTATPSSRRSCSDTTLAQLAVGAVITPSMSIAYTRMPDGGDTSVSFSCMIGGYDADVENLSLYFIPPIVFFLVAFWLFYGRVYIPVFYMHQTHALKHKSARSGFSNFVSNAMIASYGSVTARLQAAGVNELLDISNVVTANWKYMKDHVLKPAAHQNVLIFVAAFGYQAQFTLGSILVAGIVGLYNGYAADVFVTFIALVLLSASPLFMSVVAGVLLQCAYMHRKRGVSFSADSVEEDEFGRLLDVGAGVGRKRRLPTAAAAGAGAEGASSTQHVTTLGFGGGAAGRTLDSMVRSDAPEQVAETTGAHRSEFLDSAGSVDMADVTLDLDAGAEHGTETLASLVTDSGAEAGAETAAQRKDAVAEIGESIVELKKYTSVLLQRDTVAAFLANFVFYSAGLYVFAVLIYNLRLHDAPEMRVPTNYAVVGTVTWFVCTGAFNVLGLALGRMYMPRAGFKPKLAANNAVMQYSRARFVAGRMVIIGMLSSVCLIHSIIQVYFSFWNSYVDYAFWYLFVNTVFTVGAVVLLTNIFVFEILNKLDHRWQWASFHMGGSISMVVVVCSVTYYAYSDIAGYASVATYVAWSALFFVFAYTTAGSVAYVMSYVILMKIYGGLRTD